jgi:hypothetical protein
MKRILLLSVLFAGFMSCEVEGDIVKKANEVQTIDLSQATTLKTGTFSSSAHTTTGEVVYLELNGKRYVKINSLSTDAGPDLKVYMSKGVWPTQHINLGPLNASNLSKVYEIPSGTNLDDHNHVLIWCEEFSVLFGYSMLN